MASSPDAQIKISATIKQKPNRSDAVSGD